MSHRTLIAALGGLTLALTARASAPLADVPSYACAMAKDSFADLTLRPADPTVIQQTIHWTEHTPVAGRALVEAYEVTGECYIQGFVMGVGVLGTGEAFEIRSGAIVRSEASVWPLFEYADIAGERPVLPGGWFARALRVNGTGDPRGTSDYLGLWHTENGAVVATFRRTAGRADGKVEPLFTSSLRVTDIAYFPAPDTQTGRIGLVQYAGDGVTRLITFDWYHPDAFKPAR